MDPAEAEAREASTLTALFDDAEHRQRSYGTRAAQQPRFLLESARSMGRHLAMTDEEVEGRIPALAFNQIFLPAALAADATHFTEVTSRLPRSFEHVRDGVAAMEPGRQVVVAAFHMTGLTLLGALLAAAWAREHEHRPHALVSERNMGWLRLDSARWAADAAHYVSTDSGGLRRLMTGLKEGTITRLTILVDGPHAPTSPGTRALSGLAPTLGFRTALLARILTMGIPVIPLTHLWESKRLVLRWHPPLDPARGLDTVAELIEELLRRQPEQWLNWAAASLRS